MNQEQIAAIRHLVSLMDGDEVAQADANLYGDFYTHLTDFLSDIDTDTDA